MTRTIRGRGPRRIHERTQLATSELRRQLGLLRAPNADRDLRWAHPPNRLRSLGVTSSLAAASRSSRGGDDRIPADRGSARLVALVAGAVSAGRGLRRRPNRRPRAASALCAVLFTLGSLVGYPVTLGFWTFGDRRLPGVGSGRTSAREVDGPRRRRASGGVGGMDQVRRRPGQPVDRGLLMAVAASGGSRGPDGGAPRERPRAPEPSHARPSWPMPHALRSARNGQGSPASCTT